MSSNLHCGFLLVWPPGWQRAVAVTRGAIQVLSPPNASKPFELRSTFPDNRSYKGASSRSGGMSAEASMQASLAETVESGHQSQGRREWGGAGGQNLNQCSAALLPLYIYIYIPRRDTFDLTNCGTLRKTSRYTGSHKARGSSCAIYGAVGPEVAASLASDRPRPAVLGSSQRTHTTNRRPSKNSS